MKSKKISNDLAGAAGVHYACFELSRRGLVVLPTIRNTPGYDILAISPDGRRHWNLQVKTGQRRPSFWLMPTWKKIRHGEHDCYVLVRGLLDEDPPECFLVRGKEARMAVKRIQDDQRKNGRKNFPCIYVKGKHAPKGAEERWSKAWGTWRV